MTPERTSRFRSNSSATLDYPGRGTWLPRRATGG